jgi:hypothetical protein
MVFYSVSLAKQCHMPYSSDMSPKINKWSRAVKSLKKIISKKLQCWSTLLMSMLKLDCVMVQKVEETDNK